MFLQKQEENQIEYYQRLLEAAGSLSRLFGESSEPYLYYRFVENLFCKSFNAENLSRGDTSADASKDNLGIGIKTFLHKNGATFEKVAEFNKDSVSLRKLDEEQMIVEVSKLRNERIETTKRIHGLDNLIYHCVTRRDGGILLYEQPMDTISINKISNLAIDGNIINFKDESNEYKYNMSKSTLYKKFGSQNVYSDFEVKIFNDPFSELEKLFAQVRDITFSPVKEREHIFLPLYSYEKGQKVVFEKSGLNQWNAGGRPRNLGEVYIPIPKFVHNHYPDFFPPRDIKFNLKLPNNKILSAKLCQENSKALMTDPNKDLGEWLLRDILQLKEGELLTYKKLEDLGLDSVVIYKIDEENYEIDFTKIGSFDNFKNMVNDPEEIDN
jgi:hypothetical protein